MWEIIFGMFLFWWRYIKYKIYQFIFLGHAIQRHLWFEMEHPCSYPTPQLLAPSCWHVLEGRVWELWDMNPNWKMFRGDLSKLEPGSGTDPFSASWLVKMCGLVYSGSCCNELSYLVPQPPCLLCHSGLYLLEPWSCLPLCQVFPHSEKEKLTQH